MFCKLRGSLLYFRAPKNTIVVTGADWREKIRLLIWHFHIGDNHVKDGFPSSSSLNNFTEIVIQADVMHLEVVEIPKDSQSNVQVVGQVRLLSVQFQLYRRDGSALPWWWFSSTVEMVQLYRRDGTALPWWWFSSTVEMVQLYRRDGSALP